MKNILTFLSIILCIGFIQGGIVTKKLELPATEINNFEVDCGVGFLKVEGIEAQNKIEVEAEIEINGYAGEELNDFIDRYVKLSLDKSNDRALLRSQIEYRNSFRGNMHINLTIKIPLNMNLNINDGSGFTEIKNITGNLYVDDGSGELSIENIGGDVEIDDGSGKISVTDIVGNVKIDDGSGVVNITNIDGNVKVSDGSGSINIDKVSKDVTITDSGSGGLTIRNVNGKVEKND